MRLWAESLGDAFFGKPRETEIGGPKPASFAEEARIALKNTITAQLMNFAKRILISERQGK